MFETLKKPLEWIAIFIEILDMSYDCIIIFYINYFFEIYIVIEYIGKTISVI